MFPFRQFAANFLFAIFFGPSNTKPVITMKGKPYVNKGEPIHLSCDATGVRHIPEFIFWFKDGIEVTPHGRNRNSRVAVTSFRSTEQQALHSELIINHSDLQDKGTYICRSSDGVSDSLIVNILVADKNVSRRNMESGSGGSSMSALVSWKAVLWALFTCCLFAR